MKGFILLIIAIIAAILLVGGAAAFYFINNAGISTDDVDSDAVNDVVDKVSNVTSSRSSNSSSDDSDSIVDDIVSEEVKFNAQNGEGYYREVTYNDGGFRQYDTDSGKLIGSSYGSDQGKLPSME